MIPTLLGRSALFRYLIGGGTASLFSGSTSMPNASALVPCAAGAVIFLHGSGDTGPGFESSLRQTPLLRNLSDAGVRVEFPSAVPRPYTLFGGRTASVWFDRLGMDPSSPEQTDSVLASCRRIEAVLDEVVASGVPPGRIAVGGFSMGGGIALQAALRSRHSIGGVFALSSYLCDRAAVYTPEGRAAVSPPVYMAHGAADGFVRPAWGRGTADKLGKMGVDVRWRKYDGLRHEMRGDELDDLADWLGPIVLPVGGGSCAKDAKRGED